MGKTGLDELELKTPLNHAFIEAGTLAVVDGSITAAKLAAPNAEETINLRLLGTIATGALKDAALIGHAGVITGIRAWSNTAPTGAAMILDVNKNGTTLFTTQGNRPTIADGAQVSSVTAPDVTAVAAGDLLSFDADQVGSGVAGANVFVAITLKRGLVA